MSISQTEQKWQMGMEGEKAIKNWLKANGFYVVPTSLIETGGAPALEGWIVQHVLPDLQTFRDRFGAWIEVKTKSHPTYYRKSRTWEHGLKLSNWRDYLAVENHTGISAFLAVLEVDQNLLLLGHMKSLNGFGRIYDGTAMPGGQAHIFFPRDRFDMYPGPDNLNIAPLPAKSERTLSQRPAPTSQQLTLF